MRSIAGVCRQPFTPSIAKPTLKGYARAVQQVLSDGRSFGLAAGARLDADDVQQAVNRSKANVRSKGYYLAGVRRFVRFWEETQPAQ